MKAKILGWLQSLINSDEEEISLDGYPFGIVIDGFCNYAVERTIIYDSDMHVAGIRWVDPTGDLNEAYGCSFRIIYNKDCLEDTTESNRPATPDVA